MKKTKQSVYIVTKTDGTYETVTARKDLTATTKKIGVKKIRKIYRSIPMEFQTVETVRLIAVKSVTEGKEDGPENNT